MNWEPINYLTWNFDGTGQNIWDFLNNDEKRIWKNSFQYQDTRRGEKGHAEVASYFALKLQKKFSGERKIIIPAIILHDIGWSRLTKIERELFYVNDLDSVSGDEIWKRYEPILRARHQEQGKILAERLLKKIKYSKKHTNHICEIIGEHDTRKGFYSYEDEIVRSADMMWRYTLPVLNLFIKERKWSIEYTKKQMDGWLNFFNSKIKKVANIEADNSFKAYKNQK